MDFIKKQSISTWLCLLAFVVALVGIIVYGANASAGYFAGVVIAPLVVSGIFALLILAAVMVLAQLNIDGIVGKALSILADVLKIIVPMLLMICVLTFISSRIEGLSYIFFSNEEILATIQTPENLSSAYSAVAGFILFGIASLVAMAAAFFGLRKKEAL